MNWKEQFTTSTQFSKYLALVLFIILPSIGFWLGVEYSKSALIQDDSVDDTSIVFIDNTKDGKEGMTNDVRAVAETRDVVMNITLSSLSAPKAKIDLLWDYSNPEREEILERSGGWNFSTPLIGIAEPLHLIESFELINNSSTSVYLHGINNEQVDYIDIPIESNIEKAAPLMLLPDTFVDKAGTVYKCVDRDLKKTMRESHFPYENNGISDIGNKCYFDKPLVVKKGESLLLTPVLYVVSHGKVGEVLHDPFKGGEGSTTTFKVTLPVIGEERWLVPKSFEKFDDVLKANTFNVGGYIVANTEDIKLLNQVFDLSTPEGENVEFMLGETQTNIPLISYEIPSEPFLASSTTEFSDKVLGLQAFLYFNGFLEKDRITGTFDSNTVSSLKDYQRAVNVYPSGVFDEASARAVLSHKFINLVRYYESYGDERITLGLSGDTKYFRYWGIGTYSVFINDDYTGKSDVTSYTNHPDIPYVAEISYVDGRVKRGTFQNFDILNNTEKEIACSVIDQNGSTFETFKIGGNEIYLFKNSRVTGKEDSVNKESYNLSCGNKTLWVEISLESDDGR